MIIEISLRITFSAILIHIHSDGTSLKRSKKPSYWRAQAGSTVIFFNDIAHHFGCSRRTIHDLMNRYNSTVSFRVLAKPGSSCVTMLSPYHVAC